jgi:hypothetical protein
MWTTGSIIGNMQQHIECRMEGYTATVKKLEMGTHELKEKVPRVQMKAP